MTDYQKRVSIARECGIEVPPACDVFEHTQPFGRKAGWGDGDWKTLPYYTEDSNAMRLAILTLNDDEMLDYIRYLECDVLRTSHLSVFTRMAAIATADAHQQADAFLMTKGKYVK